MLTILGKTTSINVRKVLWTCEEAGIAYQQEDYGSGFASTETDAFRALNPNAPASSQVQRTLRTLMEVVLPRMVIMGQVSCTGMNGLKTIHQFCERGRGKIRW